MNSRIFVLATAITVLAGVRANADEYPVSLHIDSPGSNGGLALVSESGWAVNIKMDIELPVDQAYPAYAIQPDYPQRGHWGFIIFEDPDGCLNPPAPGWQKDPFAPECENNDASDETYLEFWPDVDLAGVEDNVGNATRQAQLVDSAGSGKLEFNSWNDGIRFCSPGTGDPDCVAFGPATGGDVVDGFGFGADDDLTGLVVIAEYGVGRTFAMPDFELTSPVGARNLAGLTNSISYDLSDLGKQNSKSAGQKGKPDEIITEFARIQAHINVLPQVVRSLILYDACTGTINYSEEPGYEDAVVSCEGDDLWRVEGGNAEIPPDKFGRADAASIYLMNNTVFELRAFLVAGQAPDVLMDENGDGKVDSQDAVAAGYTLLSNEDSVEFGQLSEFICFGGGGGSALFDLDGNGEVLVPIVCPAGPGDLGRPPR